MLDYDVYNASRDQDIDEAKRLLNTVESQIGMSEYFDRSTSVSYTVLNRWRGRLQSLLSEVGDG